MAGNIWRMLRRTGETGGRMSCCNRMVISFCDSWRKTSANILIRFSTRFWLLSFIEKTARGADPLRCDAQRRFVKLHALARGFVNHFADVTASGGERQVIHAGHFLA